jgi:hypothetical protein
VGKLCCKGAKVSINRFVKRYDRLVDMFEGLVHLKRQKHFTFTTQAKK